MVFQAKNRRSHLAFITPNSLEGRKSIVQGMGQNMDGGLVPINKVSIHPNFLAGFHDEGLCKDYVFYGRSTGLIQVYNNGLETCQRPYTT